MFCASRPLFRLAQSGGERVRAFEGGDDAFVRAQQLEGGDGFLVGDAFVAHALQIVQQGVFGADAGIVEAGGNGPGFVDLAFVALQQIGHRAVEFAGRAAAERGRVAGRVEAIAGGFGADHFAGVVEEGVEEAHGVAAAADAGDEQVGELAAFFHELRAGFVADDALEIADHLGIGVRGRRRCR